MAISLPPTSGLARARTGIINREHWLQEMVSAVRPLFLVHANVEVPQVRVSCGWPSTGGTRTRNATIGQCWPTIKAADGQVQLFISPAISDSILVSATLVHELVHAADDCKSGHKGAFARVARSVGLVGKLTATLAGPELASFLAASILELGPYPHASLDPHAGGRKKQSTRLLKLTCEAGCGYTVRVAQKWIDSGLPQCACGEGLLVPDDQSEGD